MSSVGAPIVLTAGVPVQVPGEPTGQPTVAVTVANLSNFALAVQMGNDQEFIPPWTEQSYPTGSAGPFPVLTPQLLPGAPNTGTASVLITYWWSGDPIPDTSPVTLVAAAVAAAIAGTVQVVTAPGQPIDVTGSVDVTGSTVTVTVATGDTLPISGSVTVSAGTVDISSGNITIVGGQGGINVSTDAPPVAGPGLVIAAGSTGNFDTQIAPANATALTVSLPTNGVSPGYYLRIVVTDVYTGQVLGQTYTLGGSGALVTVTLPQTASVDGYQTEVAIVNPGTETFPAAVTVKRAYYLGTTSVGVVTTVQQPISVQGAANGAELPIPVVVEGMQGAGGSVQTVPEPPGGNLSVTGIGSGGQLIAGVAGKSIRIMGLITITLQSASSGGYWTLTDGSGGPQIAGFWQDNTAPIVIDKRGVALTAGNGLYLRLAQGSGNGQIGIELAYTYVT